MKWLYTRRKEAKQIKALTAKCNKRDRKSIKEYIYSSTVCTEESPCVLSISADMVATTITGIAKVNGKIMEGYGKSRYMETIELSIPEDMNQVNHILRGVEKGSYKELMDILIEKIGWDEAFEYLEYGVLLNGKYINNEDEAGESLHKEFLSAEDPFHGGVYDWEDVQLYSTSTKPSIQLMCGGDIKNYSIGRIKSLRKKIDTLVKRVK